MSGPQNDTDTQNQETRPISVAELLARNGTIGSPPVSGRRRRRRGNSDAVTVAELTGEIPIIRDTGEIPVVRDEEQPPDQSASEAEQAPAEAPDAAVEAAAEDAAVEAEDSKTPAEAAEPPGEDSKTPAEPSDAPAQPDTARAPEAEKRARRFPKSPLRHLRVTGPQRSEYPRPIRPIRLAPAPNGQPVRGEAPEAEAEPAAKSDAEQMRPDPVDSAVEIKMDDADVSAALLPEDSAYVRSVLRTGEQTEAGALAARPGGPAVGAGFDEQPAADVDEDHGDIEADLQADRAEGSEAEQSVLAEVWGGALIVLQSMLAVAFGAGLFIAFDQLWRWNNVAALVLTVLVTLGLVAAVQVVRKTVDIVSTLIAVAVGLLVTLGPLALHAT